MENISVVKVDEKGLYWSFDNSNPQLKIKCIKSKWYEYVTVDPFPCAAHDEELVKQEAKRVYGMFPTAAIVKYAIIPFESVGRSNAWASTNYLNDEDKEIYGVECTIVLNGKRTIVHPHMTRYLIPHEYGHCMDYYITAVMNLEKKKEDSDSSNDSHIFRNLYAEMRGCEMNDDEYGGGRWKNNIGEIIADDFRIAVCGTDTDFYVHDKVCHPFDDDNVFKFWMEMKDKYGLKK